MTNKILDLNEALVSKILYDFDTELQTRFSSSLFQFILATDEISDGNVADKVMSNAPEEASGFFVVPKVVE